MSLTFNLKKEWFDKIKSDEKTHEYKEVKPYWDKRFLKIAFDLTDKIWFSTNLKYTRYLKTFIG